MKPTLDMEEQQTEADLGDVSLHDDDPRPVVVTGMDVHRVLDDLDRALAATDPLLFQRSNQLVVVVGSKPNDKLAVPPDTPILRPVVAASLLPRVTEHVNFQRRVKPDKAELTVAKVERREPRWSAEPCVPPPVVLSAFIAKPSWRHIRRIRGIAIAPFMRPDGSIVQTPGYDSTTSYLYEPSAKFPPVPESPTQEDARRSLAELNEIFCDFPHVSDSDRMVPIAAAMTVIARPGICGAIPAFIFDASTRGSGKTLQCDVVSAIATGKRAERQSFPDEDVELDKTLCAYALAGVPILLLDNVTRVFGGGPLDKVLTAGGNVSFRQLGEMEIRSVPWLSTIMASGNGISFHEDTARRVLVSRLESPFENPESRPESAFKRLHLIPWVVEHRADLVVHILTILRAYALKGFPDADCPRWGSFEEWSRLIPHAIVFAGGADPMNARPTVSSSGGGSADSDHLAVILDAMTLTCRDHEVTVHEFVRRLFGAEAMGNSELATARDSVRAVTKSRVGKEIDAGALGYYFRSRRGRVIAGKRLERVETDGKHKGSVRWRAVAVADPQSGTVLVAANVMGDEPSPIYPPSHPPAA